MHGRCQGGYLPSLQADPDVYAIVCGDDGMVFGAAEPSDRG
jgi:hypothetical protein